MNLEEKIKHIKEYPEQHKHGSMNGIINCSMDNGAINMTIFDAHQQYANYGTNGGVRCDVSEGPCSCGAWH